MSASRSTPTPATVGAVVLTWRDRELTAACVARLVGHPRVARVIVVDNEADGSIASAFEPNPSLDIVELTSNTGFAVGVNSGLRQLLDDPSLDEFLVINNDATLTHHDIDRLVSALDGDPGLGIVGPRIETPTGTKFSAGGIVNRFTWGIRQPRPGEHPDFLTWACVLVRRSTFERVGLLDERFFMYWEDVEFGFRLREAGVRFSEVPDAVLIHAVSSSHSRAGSRILAYSSQAFRHFLRLHGGAGTVTGLARLGAKVALCTVKGDMPGARYVIAGWKLGRNAPDPAYVAFEKLP
ncbi:glycosyltransferase family 2 protein [Microbacterium aurantiacum]|uniref:glycosyltransferase family 2 protein n=1 Tax=Microbacterium aurantiacum TaxID=162393 RepID=UPI001F1C1455|nr:glycosyltransferase family 2 protein [Microbacterium aurantiacum]